MPQQPEARPSYLFRFGVVARHVLGLTWEWVDMDGKHVSYVIAEHVDYASTLSEQFLQIRSNR